jgi:NADH-quinone oxidoreductase subunit N
MTATDFSWLVLLPSLVLTGTALVMIIADLWTEGPDRDALGWLGIAGLIVTAVVSLTLWNRHEIAFSGGMALDRYALFFNLLFCATGILILLMSMNYLETTDIRIGDYYTLTMLALTGMVMMAAATDLIIIFLALEIMSMAVYALAGIWRRQLRSNEAALKYFLIGAFATGFLLFGIALIYGATGTTQLAQIGAKLAGGGGETRTLVLAGVALLIVGFGFKVAAVPFHLWTPDVYEGAPTTITALMAVGVKAAAFAAFARVFGDALRPLLPDWQGIVWMLAVLTMTVGNVIAVLQQNIKRMLAYSSIAHAGYLLVGLVAIDDGGGAALLFYLVAYTLMNAGAFAVVIAVGRRGAPNEQLDDYAGLGFRYPALGLAMTLFMLSLAGIPPLVGFAGKFYLFGAAVKAGFVGLAVIGVLNSVVSVYYYAGVLVRMYMVEGGTVIDALSQRPYLAATVLLTGAGTVLLGLFPSFAYEVARQSFAALAA